MIQRGLKQAIVTVILGTLLLIGSPLSYAATPSETDAGTLYVAPIALSENSTITLISPTEYAAVAEKLFGALKETHSLFTEMFGPLPPINTTLRLMEEWRFYATTGAPSWTNALYLHGQIIIPVEAEITDWDNLLRSVKHEYTHAITATISNNRIPGWLDEGLAQWAEGSENSALRPSLVRYLRSKDPVAFSLMQGGFTRMDTNMVAAAYAQSLLATKALAETFGFKKINSLLVRLGKQETFEDAFSDSLGLDVFTFERRFGDRLMTWVRGLSEEAPKPALVAANLPKGSDSRARAELRPNPSR